MWKDYFYFSKNQQSGIIVFIILILLVLLLYYLLPYFVSEKKIEGTDFLTEIDNFKIEVARQDSLILAEKERKIAEIKRKQIEYENRKAAWAAAKKEEEIPIKLFKFNPNSADSLQLRSLGLKPKTISNILKYRKKGGNFKNAEDFSKIYGLSEKQYKLLESYIAIPPKEKVATEQTEEKNKKTEKKLIVELNSADTTSLMRIVGVAAYSAKEILYFRKKIGGFYSTEQLKEIKSIQPENLQLILPQCSADSNLIRKIKINSASVEYLKSHPYINFYQAKAIYEYRKAKGEIKNLEELKKLPDFGPDDWERLRHYLAFD